MSDVIDINKFKNKVRDKDVDALESYIYSLYYELAEGRITMGEMNRKIQEYVSQNDISQTKFLELEKKLMERYGYDPSILDNQESPDASVMMAASNLRQKYGDSQKQAVMIRMEIKNDKNDCVILGNGSEIFIYSSGKVELEDNELNEYLVSYKRQFGEKTLKVHVSSDTGVYDY